MKDKSDISTRTDVELLVRLFYEKAMKDELIGEFFTSIMPIDPAEHFPIMFDFWETMLLDHMKYKGNPLTKHFELNRKKRLEKSHFDRWLALWKATVIENFEGKNAKTAIERATSIAQLMHFKMEQQSGA